MTNKRIKDTLMNLITFLSGAILLNPLLSLFEIKLLSKEAINEVERIKMIDKIDIQLKSVREVFGLDYYGGN